ncbi:MAG: DUF4114 domain-containing protein [Brasilonema angustatum HA4187-MV1]|jgi:pimeloyl-ACP methyl ester carboxylesterase|nr:DUF4114 domain-containing protein [Brasilonema angustatum HA4187-MV1]
MLSETTENALDLNGSAGNAFNTDLQSETISGSYSNGLRSGVFQVGSTGKVSFRNELHNAAYESEVAIIKFSGLENYEIGSNAFTQEATRRALSNSVFGHIIISDSTERTRLTGDSNRRKAGKYLGTQTFDMTPGDLVIFMLFPNSRAKDVLTNPNSEEEKPFYSVKELNPDKASHFTLFRRTLSSGSVFAVEDLLEDGNSDRDFNDNVFYTQGLIGETEPFDNLINPSHNWRNSEVGEELLYGNLNPPLLLDRGIILPVGGPFIDSVKENVSISNIPNQVKIGDKITIKGKTKERSLNFTIENTKLKIDNFELKDDNFVVNLNFPDNFSPGEYLLNINNSNNRSIYSSTINIQDPEETQEPWKLDLHKNYEFLAKVASYKDEDKDITDSGYSIDSTFKDSFTGLYALGLISKEDGKPPVLLFRGTTVTDWGDISTDLELNGVGYSQFFDSYDPNRESLNDKIENWLKKVAINFGKADIVGHSLGGALAQRTAVEFPDLTGRTVTFNSPGIDTRSVSRFKGDSNKVFHYIEQDDTVSRAGEEFIPGTVVKASDRLLLSGIPIKPILFALGFTTILVNDFIINPHKEIFLSNDERFQKEKISIDSLNNLNWNGYTGAKRSSWEDTRKKSGTGYESIKAVKNSISSFLVRDNSLPYEYQTTIPIIPII